MKGDEDVITISTNRRLFFLYDSTYKGLSITLHIVTDSINPDEIEWQMLFDNGDNKNDEIESWKTIYKIKSRYKGYVNARIETWFRHYWEFINDSDYSHVSVADRNVFYFKFLSKDESLKINFIRRPAVVGFLNGSTLAQAAIEAKHYSIPPTA